MGLLLKELAEDSRSLGLFVLALLQAGLHFHVDGAAPTFLERVQLWLGFEHFVTIAVRNVLIGEIFIRVRAGFFHRSRLLLLPVEGRFISVSFLVLMTFDVGTEPKRDHGSLGCVACVRIYKLDLRVRHLLDFLKLACVDAGRGFSGTRRH